MVKPRYRDPPGDAGPAAHSLRASLLPVDGAPDADPSSLCSSDGNKRREAREAPEISTLPDNMTRVVVRRYCSSSRVPHWLLEFLFVLKMNQKKPTERSLDAEKLCSEDGAAELL